MGPNLVSIRGIAYVFGGDLYSAIRGQGTGFVQTVTMNFAKMGHSTIEEYSSSHSTGKSAEDSGPDHFPGHRIKA